MATELLPFDNMQYAYSDTSSDAFARMHLLNPYSEGRSDVEILGIFGSCVELLSPTPVLPGALIQLHLQTRGAFLLGEARHCIPAGSTFHVAIDLQDAYPARDLTQVRQITQSVRTY